MASTKRLTSVCHSIAHHAASGLSYIHPHLRQLCRRAGLESALIDLRREAPYPERLPPHEPLRLALLALRKRSAEILQSEGFTLDELVGLDLQVDFPASTPSDYCSSCYVTLKHASAKTFSSGVNDKGEQVVRLAGG